MALAANAPWSFLGVFFIKDLICSDVVRLTDPMETLENVINKKLSYRRETACHVDFFKITANPV